MLTFRYQSQFWDRLTSVHVFVCVCVHVNSCSIHWKWRRHDRTEHIGSIQWRNVCSGSTNRVMDTPIELSTVHWTADLRRQWFDNNSDGNAGPAATEKLIDSYKYRADVSGGRKKTRWRRPERDRPPPSRRQRNSPGRYFRTAIVNVTRNGGFAVSCYLTIRRIGWWSTVRPRSSRSAIVL